MQQELLTEEDNLVSIIKNKGKKFLKIELKIGINYGERLVKIGHNNPSVLYIGIEIKKDNITQALYQVQEKKMDNILLINGEAFSILKKIKLNHFISQVHLYFPTPKKSAFPSLYSKGLEYHQRLVNKSFITELERLLQDGGIFRFATDHEEYYFYTIELFNLENWIAIDWSPLNIELKKNHLVGSFCEKKFVDEIDGATTYHFRVIKL